MKAPLTGISLKLFHLWCYLIPILSGLFGVALIVVNVRTRSFGGISISETVIDINNTVFFAVTIRNKIKVPGTPVTMERITVALLQTSLIGFLIEIAISIARHFQPDIPAAIYAIAPGLIVLVTPIFAFNEKATFGWFKFQGIS